MRHIVALTFFLLGVGMANVQAATTASYYGTNPELFGTVPLGQSTSITRTIVRNADSQTGEATQIAVTATGSGYTLTGGTCLATPTLYPPSDTCTVTMTFTPSVPGAAVGNLAIDCTIVGLVGGITMNCGSPTPVTMNIALQGTGVGSLAALPSSGRFGLSALALLLFGFALRSMRRRTQD